VHKHLVNIRERLNATTTAAAAVMAAKAGLV
jgi:DNA-binding NarL/FixJ family response regulator